MIINHFKFNFKFNKIYDGSSSSVEYTDKTSNLIGIFHMGKVFAEDIVNKLNSNDDIEGVNIIYNKSKNGNAVIHFNCNNSRYRYNKDFIISNNIIIENSYIVSKEEIRLKNTVLYLCTIKYKEWMCSKYKRYYTTLFQEKDKGGNIITFSKSLNDEAPWYKGKNVSIHYPKFQGDLINIIDSKYKAEYIKNQIQPNQIERLKWINGEHVLKITTDYRNARHLLNKFYNEFYICMLNYYKVVLKVENINTKYKLVNYVREHKCVHMSYYENKHGFKFEDFCEYFKQVLGVPSNSKIDLFVYLFLMLNINNVFDYIIGLVFTYDYQKYIFNYFLSTDLPYIEDCNMLNYELLFSQVDSNRLLKEFYNIFIKEKRVVQKSEKYNTYDFGIGKIKIPLDVVAKMEELN